MARVQVRPADPAAEDLDPDLAGPGNGLGTLDQVELTVLAGDRSHQARLSSHDVAPSRPLRPGLPCSAPAMPRRNALVSLLGALACATLIAGCGGDSATTAPTGPFQPRATLRAIGGTVRTEKPRLMMRVEAKPGDENIRSVA